VEDDAAQSSETNRSSLQWIASAFFELFALGSEITLHDSIRFLGEAALGEVTMGIEDDGSFAFDILGSVEVTADVVAGHAGEVDFLDGVVALIDLAVYHGVERSLFGQGEQAERDEELRSQLSCSSLPRFLAGILGSEGIGSIEMVGFESAIVGEAWWGEDLRGGITSIDDSSETAYEQD